MPGGSRPVHDAGVLGRSWDERPLGRGEARGVKHPLAHLGHVSVPPIIATVIVGQNHVVKGGPSVVAGHPQPHRRLRETGLGIEVGMM
jgi:hypothetical protein